MNYIPTDDVGDDTGAIQEEYNAIVMPASKDNNKTMNKEKETTLKDGSGRFITVAVLAFLIGFGVGFLVFSGGYSGDELESTDDLTTTNDDGTLLTDDREEVEPVTVSDVLIVVNDQNFGGTVLIDSVSLDRSSWIVVFEDNAGVPGSILGAQRYDVGEVQNGVVNLLRTTTADSIYYVKVHSDDGDKQFDFNRDVPYLDEAGNEVMTTFRTLTGTPR